MGAPISVKNCSRRVRRYTSSIGWFTISLTLQKTREKYKNAHIFNIKGGLIDPNNASSKDPLKMRVTFLLLALNRFSEDFGIRSADLYFLVETLDKSCALVVALLEARYRRLISPPATASATQMSFCMACNVSLWLRR